MRKTIGSFRIEYFDIEYFKKTQKADETNINCVDS